jgi:fibronectin-binding autotransporter adhesin
MLHRSFVVTALVIAASIPLLSTREASAQASGTWTGAGDGVDGLPGPDGLWSNVGNWAGGTVADGANNTANFNTLDIADQFGVTGFGAARVTLDVPKTLGHLIFGDTNAATPGAWEVLDGGNLLTLADAAKPTITVNPLGPLSPGGLPPTLDDAAIRPSLAGTNGFNKLGTGVLTVAGTANTLTGIINVNAGTLRIAAGTVFDFETAITPDVLKFTLASGATLENNAFIRDVTAASGSTINSTDGIGANVAGTTGVNITGGGAMTINNNATVSRFFRDISGAGATLNFNLAGGGLTTSVDGNWAVNGALAAVNFTGNNATQGQVRLRNNGGQFNANSFATTAVTLSNILLFTNTNSGGNTNTIGSLSGNATSTLQGGAAGSVVTYQIGGLNTNTTFAGSITTGNGINLFKQGSGTLELTSAVPGTLSFAPTTNAIANRRGGVTRIEAGVLKVSGEARLPGGVAEVTHGVVGLGDLYTTVDIRTGATLDVSGSTGVYSSSALQQTIGVGTIVGNYNHDEGVLAPGDTNVGGNTAALTATAGTLTFANTLSFAGTGQVNFDISPSLVSGNDRLQVGGADLAGTPVIKVGFLGGASNGAYTLLNSNTPLVGTTAGWTVLWEGRGAAPTISQTSTQVKLNVSAGAAGNLNWSGAIDGVWNAGTAGTSNWRNTGTNAADKFFQLDNVAFRDTFDGVNAPTTTTITLNTTVSPSSVLVDSTLDYTVSGSGRITGGGSFTKRGSGSFTITTANDYSGTTTIEAGTLNIGATGSIGSGPLVMSGGALIKGGGTIANTLTLSGTNRIAHANPGTLTISGPISGTGTLTLGNANSAAPGTILGTDLSGSSAGFSGSIVVGEFDNVNMINAPIALRLTSSASGNGSVAWNLGDTGSNLGSKVDGVPTTHQLGSLSGGVNSGLSGHNSSAGAANVTWQIGALNTSSTFDGVISDGNQTGGANNTSILKVGTGTLTLGAFSTYTGSTRISGGTLSISQAYLGDVSDVFINTGSVLDLNLGLGVSDTIDSLFLGGAPQAPGTYGAVGSGATFTSAFFSGTGTLTVSSLGVALIPGDFDFNGAVNAADLAVWRGAFGNSAGGDADGDLDTDGNDFLIWQRFLGATSVTATAAAVPEPAMLALVALAVPALVSAGRRRRA